MHPISSLSLTPPSPSPLLPAYPPSPPPRCSGMDTETKFIAMRLFEAINEAYEVFVEAEGSA